MEHTRILDGKIIFPAEASTKQYAQRLDSQDPLRSFRDEFIVPTKASLKSKSLTKPGRLCHITAPLIQTNTR